MWWKLHINEANCWWENDWGKVRVNSIYHSDNEQLVRKWFKVIIKGRYVDTLWSKLIYYITIFLNTYFCWQQPSSQNVLISQTKCQFIIMLVFTLGVWVCCSTPSGLPVIPELQLQTSDITKPVIMTLWFPNTVVTKSETKQGWGDTFERWRRLRTAPTLLIFSCTQKIQLT